MSEWPKMCLEMYSERALPWMLHTCCGLCLVAYGDGVVNLVLALALQTVVLPTPSSERLCQLSVQAPESSKMKEATTDGLNPASLVLEM